MSPEKSEQNPAEFDIENSLLDQDIAKLMLVKDLMDQNFLSRLEEEVPNGYVKIESFGKSSFSHTNLRNSILKQTGYDIKFTKPDEEDSNRSICSSFVSSADSLKVGGIWVILHADSIKNFDKEEEMYSLGQEKQEATELVAASLESTSNEQKELLENARKMDDYLFDVKVAGSTLTYGSQLLEEELHATVTNDYEKNIYKDSSEVAADIAELSDAKKDILRRAITIILFRTSGITGEIYSELREQYTTDYNLVRQAGIKPMTFEEIAGMTQAAINNVLEALPELRPTKKAEPESQ